VTAVFAVLGSPFSVLGSCSRFGFVAERQRAVAEPEHEPRTENLELRTMLVTEQEKT
jgi:hypothetical protein